MKLAWRIVSVVIGVLFVFAGVIKIVEFPPFGPFLIDPMAYVTKIFDFQSYGLLDPMAFARDVDNYKILPWTISVPLALYLPWLEIICGLALIFRRLYSGALVLLLALLVVFIGASLVAKARGIDISCGCFGHVSDQLSFAWHMVLDFAIVAGVFALWRWDSASPPVTEQISR